MSKHQANVRVVLGPVARELIGDQEENRPKALDDAITGLLEKLDANAGGCSRDDDPYSAHLASLTKAVHDQATLLHSLARVVAIETKMTRVLIASLMSQSNQDQQTLLSFATKAVDDIHKSYPLVSEPEMDAMRRSETSAQAAILHDLERNGLTNPLQRDAEIER